MELSPDRIIIADLGAVQINATLAFSWLVMAILVVGSWLVTRNLSTGPELSRWQNVLETIVSAIRGQIHDVTGEKTDRYLPFIGTLFLFISVANFLDIFPGYEPPTGSLSTTAALAVCVFIAVPFFSITERGIGHYLRSYVRPSPIMLPFNIISELSRTLALAVRLFGNILSGRILVAIIITLVPLFLPTVLQIFGLVIGQIQAYIFAVLATVYIASAAHD
ncbi:MAG: F0F1 ATP synthase subunit A [Aggregatilineales bacterium]